MGEGRAAPLTQLFPKTDSVLPRANKREKYKPFAGPPDPPIDRSHGHDSAPMKARANNA
jgi:hypothetical protein